MATGKTGNPLALQVEDDVFQSVTRDATEAIAEEEEETTMLSTKSEDNDQTENGTPGDFEMNSMMAKEYGPHDENENGNFFTKGVEKIEHAIRDFISVHEQKIKRGMYTILLIVYFVYFAYCMHYRFGDEGSIVLLFITICLVWKLLCIFLDSKGFWTLPKSFQSFIGSRKGRRFRKILRYFTYTVACIVVGTYLGMDVFSQNPQNLQAFFGMFVLIFTCFLMSYKPSKVNWHPVFWAFIIQFAVATLTLRTEIGYNMFKWLGDQVQRLFTYSDAGSRFVIGDNFSKMGIAFQSTGAFIFMNGLIFLVNQWGGIEFIVLKLGRFLSFCLETGPVESVVAAANVFIGLSEAPLLIRPYLPTVTNSELHTIMTCGFASISGGLMGLFISLGAPANHLLTAAVISAPAALAISKLMYPEIETVSLENQRNLKILDNKENNSLNAFSEGAVLALTISCAVWANMLAFVSALSLLDSLCGWFGERAGVEGLTFDMICSYLLFPIAYAMGVDRNDCMKVGSLIGVKLFATPVVSYTNLGFLIENRKMFEDYVLSSSNNTWHWSGDDIVLEASNITLVNGFLSERSEAISTYAMCGFSAFTAIGICLGALIPLCPPRKKDVINLILRAFIAGNMASFATGAIAGVLFSSDRQV